MRQNACPSQALRPVHKTIVYIRNLFLEKDVWREGGEKTRFEHCQSILMEACNGPHLCVDVQQ